jgi:hypothetical protein
MNDHAFLAAFEAAVIPAERWKHRDHVRVAFLYLRALPFAVAVEQLRSGIRALNRAHGGVDTLTSGYHETLTVAWARLVAAAIAQADPVLDFAMFAAAQPALLDKALLRAHYTSALMLSPEARASFVEPDLIPLPALPIR